MLVVEHLPAVAQIESYGARPSRRLGPLPRLDEQLAAHDRLGVRHAVAGSIAPEDAAVDFVQADDLSRSLGRAGSLRSDGHDPAAREDRPAGEAERLRPLFRPLGEVHRRHARPAAVDGIELVHNIAAVPAQSGGLDRCSRGVHAPDCPCRRVPELHCHLLIPRCQDLVVPEREQPRRARADVDRTEDRAGGFVEDDDVYPHTRREVLDYSQEHLVVPGDDFVARPPGHVHTPPLKARRRVDREDE